MRKLKKGDVLKCTPIAVVVSDVAVDSDARRITAKASVGRIEIDETWRVEQVFSDGAIAVRSCPVGDPAGGHAFVIHDARGLVHADDTRIDHVAAGCETWGCTRTLHGLCGRFSDAG